MKPPQLTVIIVLLLSRSAAVDFLFNSFSGSHILLVGDARIDSTVLRLTNDSNYYSIGRAFFPSPLRLLPSSASHGGGRNLSSFSTSFVFSIMPEIRNNPGFGLAFVLSNSTSPPGAISGQYFGLFSNRTHRSAYPLLAVEFDTGQNPEFNDPDGNHVGIDLNYIVSVVCRSAGYFQRSSSQSPAMKFVPIDMTTGENIRAWIEFDGPRSQINVTVAPAGNPRPPRPLISYVDPAIADFISPEMFVGFSASKVKWVEVQRILAWSLSDNGRPARELNTTTLPAFLPTSPPSSQSSTSSPLSAAAIAGIALASIPLLLLCFGWVYYRNRGRWINVKRQEELWEELDLNFWPRRFAYEDLWKATNGFSPDRLLGSGGFGKVYRGMIRGEKEEDEEEEEVAVKCISHDSKQGLREFMAEISSLGRLEHRSLVHMRGWCRKGTDLMLVYEYMPNGNLSRWIFSDAEGGADGKMMGWQDRRQVVTDVAEGLDYLHHGWEKVVLHRDVKSSNILLDSGMRGRLGDFGLAKLYERGASPGNTRVVGTVGYMAPELAVATSATAASDVYSFGVVVLEAATGRKAIEMAGGLEEEDRLLVDWVREMYGKGRLAAAADRKVVEEDSGGGRGASVEEVEMMMKLGMACCHPEAERRPTMSEVVELLRVAEGGRSAFRRD